MPSLPAESDPRLTGVAFVTLTHGPVDSLAEAAALRGVPPAKVIKTMVVRRTDDDYVFVLVPGDRVIDWPKLRSVLGERRLSMPDAEEALAVTGYVRGTITPFGAKAKLPVVLDERLIASTVSIGAGEHGASLTMQGDDLAEALDATVVDVTKQQT